MSKTYSLRGLHCDPEIPNHDAHVWAFILADGDEGDEWTDEDEAAFEEWQAEKREQIAREWEADELWED